MKKIPLSQSQFALVDDKDYEYLNQFKWYAKKDSKKDKTFYAARDIGIYGKRKRIYMHQIIGKRIGLKGKIDHKDFNGLNDRRINLREATRIQQNQHRRRFKNNTSGYKGVYCDKRRKKWQSYITADHKRIHLGYFTNKKKTAIAYDFAAIKYFGEFAVLNFPIASRKLS